MSVNPQAPTQPDAAATSAVGGSEATSQTEATSQEKISAKIYAELARKEKALRAKEESWKAQLAEKEQGWSAKEQEYLQKYIPKEKLLTDTVGTLHELGIGYDQLVQLALNPPSQESLMNMQLQAKIKELEDKLEGKFKSFEETQQQAQQKQVEEALGQFKQQTKSLIAKDKDNYELINAYGDEGVDTVVEFIHEHWKRTKEVMSVEDAAKQVEDYFLAQSMKFLELNKLKSKLAPQPQTPQDPAKPQASKTLTQSNAPLASKPMDRRERAILAMQGKL